MKKMKMKGILHFYNVLYERAMKIAPSFRSSSKRVILIPVFLIVLVFLYGFSSSERLMQRFAGIMDQFGFTSTTENPGLNFKCYINGKRYIISKEVCDYMRDAINNSEESQASEPSPFVEEQNKVSDPISTPDPENQAVSCFIHPKCGGGTIQLKRGECEKTICCLVGDSMNFYMSRAQCMQEQEDYWRTQRQNQE